MIEALQFEFMRNALYAAVLASIACGVIGSYVVAKRIAAISGSIAHATFGGLGIAYYLGINPVWGIIPFGLLAAMGIGLLSRRTRVAEDTAISMFWAVGMALGVLLIGMVPGYAPDLFGYLFGNILTIPAVDVLLMGVLDILIVFVVFFFYKEFLALCYDEDYAAVAGIKVLPLYLLLLCLVALTVVMLVRVVGIILVIALLTIPAAIARQYTHNLRTMMVLASSLGIVLTVSGLALSYVLDLPSGAAIILLAGAVFVASSVLSQLSFRR